MPFIRVGLAKGKGYAEGWDAIFGKKKAKAKPAKAAGKRAAKKKAKK